jgi:hypothetical protein
LLAALGAQMAAAATAAAYRLAARSDPDTGTTFADYVDVALVSLFVAAYGAATLLLGTNLAALGYRRRVTGSLHVAGACMLAAALENIVEDGFEVDWLVWLWILLVATSWICLLFAGGTLMTARETRLLGLLLAAPPPIALAFDFTGWLPAAFASGAGVTILVARDAAVPDENGSQR